MAIVTSGSFPETDFALRAFEAAQRMQARFAQHTISADLTRDAALGLHPNVLGNKTVTGFESLRQIALFMCIAEALTQLQRLHPGGVHYRVAPEPEPAQDLTIVSAEEPNSVGAIVLPCMSVGLGRQVAGAVRRLARHSMKHRYVFFAPLLGSREAEGRAEKYERNGVQVWSIHA